MPDPRVAPSGKSGPKPCTYRCRCERCGWVGYRLGWFRQHPSPSTPQTRVHVDPCPRCKNVTVLGLSPKIGWVWG